MTKQPIPNSLRTHRKAAGLRQLDVARALGLASTDRISRWENGSAVPHLKNLFGLAILYRIPPQELYNELYQSILNPASVPRMESAGSLTSPSLEPSVISLDVGESISTQLLGDNSDGSQSYIYTDTEQVAYVSSNPMIADIDTNGTVTLKAIGDATISASYQGLKAQLLVSSVAPTKGRLFGNITTNGDFRIALLSTVGTTNIIQTSTDLISWSSLATIYNTNGIIQFQDNTKMPRRFYRVLLE